MKHNTPYGLDMKLITMMLTMIGSEIIFKMNMRIEKSTNKILLRNLSINYLLKWLVIEAVATMNPQQVQVVL